MENLCKEVWKPVVGYEGYYECSNLGRVKSVDRMIRNGGNTGKFHLYKGKVLKRKIKPNGYCIVCFSCDGEISTHHIHRLVAQTFIPNPDNLPCVNHKDENKLNNCVDNLEWCDYVYNANYGTAPKRRINTGIINGTIYKPEEREEKRKEKQKEYYNAKIKGNPIIRERNKLKMREYRDSMSEEKKNEILAKKRKYHKDTYKPVGQYVTPIVVYTINGEFIGEYESQTKCSQILSIPQGCISNCCRNKIKHFRNYIIKYKEGANYKPLQ